MPKSLKVTAKARLSSAACVRLINPFKAQSIDLLQIQLPAAHLTLVQSIWADRVPQACVLAFSARAAGTPR